MKQSHPLSQFCVGSLWILKFFSSIHWTAAEIGWKPPAIDHLSLSQKLWSTVINEKLVTCVGIAAGNETDDQW